MISIVLNSLSFDVVMFNVMNVDIAILICVKTKEEIVIKRPEFKVPLRNDDIVQTEA